MRRGQQVFDTVITTTLQSLNCEELALRMFWNGSKFLTQNCHSLTLKKRPWSRWTLKKGRSECLLWGGACAPKLHHATIAGTAPRGCASDESLAHLEAMNKMHIWPYWVYRGAPKSFIRSTCFVFSWSVQVESGTRPNKGGPREHWYFCSPSHGHLAFLGSNY